jgi:16S rRNA (guanine527-N7)-methyltransferase
VILQAEPVQAATVFGDRVGLARRYAELLTTVGIERGLLGPREADRVWTRHLLNATTLAADIAAGSSIVDLGSGAGIPGIPLALACPDLTVCLLEPMLRRVLFLEQCLAQLGLPITVMRGRAGDVTMQVDTVVVRAVATLDRLIPLAGTLLRPGGRLLALKGESAAAEVAAAEPILGRIGAKVAIRSATSPDGERTFVVRVEFPPQRGQDGRAVPTAAPPGAQ